MRIIMAPVGSAGDVHPHVGIALALQRRGHDVSVIANPYFAPILERVGLPVVPLGTVEDYHEVLGDPDIWHARRGLGVIGSAAGRHAAEIVRVLRKQVAGDTPLLVANGLAFGARAAHEALGLPLVTLHLQPTAFLSAHDLAVPHVWLRSINRWPGPVRRLALAAADRLTDRALAPGANAPARRVRPAARAAHRARVVAFAAVRHRAVPDWFAAAQPDWPPHTTLTGFPLYDEGDAIPPAPALEAWLAAGDRPVVFVAGTGNRQAARFFQAGADACRRLGRRGLLLTKFTEQIPHPLPSGVRHVEYIPFGRVLPRAAAIVHHGGIGTAAQALRAGCPQLVTPMTFDQPDNAVRLERLGVARILRPAACTPRTMARALDALLRSDDTAHACRAAARRFEQVDPVTRTCELIEAAA